MYIEAITYRPLSVKELAGQEFSGAQEIRETVFLRCGGSPVELRDCEGVPSSFLLHVFDALHRYSLECVVRTPLGVFALFSHTAAVVRPPDVDMRFVNEAEDGQSLPQKRDGEFHVDLLVFKKKGKHARTMQEIETAWKAFIASYGNGAAVTVLHGDVDLFFLLLVVHACYGKTGALFFDNGKERIGIFDRTKV